MKVILIFLILTVNALSLEFLGSDKDGVEFYCIDSSVYAYIALPNLGSPEKMYIPVVKTTNEGKTIKLPCMLFNKWYDETKEL